MKRYIFSILPLATVMLLFVSGCDKREPTVYEDVPRIYFYHDKYKTSWDEDAGLTQGDSIVFSLKTSKDVTEGDTYTYYIVAQTVGGAAPYDRAVSLKQINTGHDSVAVPGKNFTPFDQIADRLIVPAGETQAMIPTEILRNDDISERQVVLELELVPNEYFETGIPELMTIKFYFTDAYTKPTLWDTFYKNYFGLSWGQMKFDFLVKYVSGVEFDWEDRSQPSDMIAYWGVLAKDLYEEYVDQYGPLTERDGSEVTFYE